jgi:alkylation response protein AidB-like acyl-CoA dehydrogenase
VAADLLTRTEALVSDGPDPSADGGFPFRGAQFDAGLAWVHLPKGCGGLGIDERYQPVVDGVLLAAGVVPGHLRNPVGYGNVAPVLAAHGTSAQRADFLRRCFTVEDIWCQLMSEPGAGSDVAGLATRTVRDGEGWRITGQKVWTSLAHVARWGLIITRTDPDVPKHQGLTCFILDMREPGIDVRPLRMITGKADFNEVFLNDVWVPDSRRVGAVGDGWRVVKSNLEGERLAFGREGGEVAPWDDLLARWREQGATADPALTDRVLDGVTRGRAARITAARAEAGDPVHAAVVKVLYSELTQQCLTLALTLQGEAGLLHEPDGYAFEQPDHVGIMQGGPGTRWLRSQALTIEGGTSNMMRNAIGEGVLGLPREPRVDVGIPWRDVPRG